MRKKTTAAIGAIAGAALAVSMALPASAGESDLQALAELNTGAAISEIEAGLTDYARVHGITYDEALTEALEEATTSVAGSQSLDAIQRDITAWLGGGTPEPVVAALGAAANVGDVFVAPASTFGVQHGHTGIYVGRGTVVEALVGQKSRAVSAATRLVPLGTVKQSVGVATAQREAAARYANRALTGLSYNANFVVNRATGADSMNCSQLVWAAYKRGAGVDIDGNGGLGVYPFDIKTSTYLSTYATLR
jgi:uncharacterized protein YycO